MNLRWIGLIALVGSLLIAGWVQAKEQSKVQSPGAEVQSPEDGHKSQVTSHKSQDTKNPGAQTLPGEVPGVVAGEPLLVGWMELSGHLREGPAPFAWAAQSKSKHSMRKVLEQLKHVAQNKRFAGLVIFLDQPDLELAQLAELDTAIQKIRKQKNKKVVVFAEAYDLRGYLLACSADQILLQRKGMLELTGLGVEEMYLAGLLEKVGIKADFLQVGRFKGADESLTRKGPSPEWNQNFDALLDDLYEQFITRITKARKMNRVQLEQAMAEVWSMSDQDYRKRKLIDQVVDRDLQEATEKLFGENFEWDEDMGQEPVIGLGDNPLAMLKLLMETQKPRVTQPSIAMIHASGAIMSGDSRMSGQRTGLFSSEAIGSRTMVELLGEARDNPFIKGVVIRIDSPGGSALASEIIWQAMRELGEEKPVFVSIGSMAASGGYYMASAAHEVYVSPASIVGSIGVVGGKLSLGGLYEKLGISVHRRSRGPMGDMFNSVSGFTPEQRLALQGAFNRTYEQFLDRVKTGRGKRLDDVGSVAEGRLFTGVQAIKNGMADKLGGPDQAVSDLAAQLKMKPGEYQVIDMPGPMSLPEYLESIFGADAQAPLSRLAGEDAAAMSMAGQLLGPRAWRQAQAAMQGLLLLRQEPVITLMPSIIDLR